MGSAPRCWSLVVDHLGRPTTQNAVHRMHHRDASRDRKRWREAGCVLGRVHHLPTLAAIEVEAWGRYPDRRSLPDADAIAPAVKGVIDGLVDAGVIPDDGPDHLHAVTYRRPEVAPGPPALIVEVRPSLGGKE